jgi:hypothetical protein
VLLVRGVREGREVGERGAREGRGRTARMGDGRRKAASPSPWATIIVIHRVHVLALALLAFCLALPGAIYTTTATQHCNYKCLVTVTAGGLWIRSPPVDAGTRSVQARGSAVDKSQNKRSQCA